MEKAMREQILALRGIFSYSLIAKRFGITRNAVAGIMWRADWPAGKRTRSKSGDLNACGMGRHGGGQYARHTELNSR